MSYRFILHEYAQEDYEISLRWYAERSQQAAEGFVKAINDTLLLICEHPSGWRNTYKNFHEIAVKKYPYTIIYSIEENKKMVVVSSIYHYKKKPKLKFRR